MAMVDHVDDTEVMRMFDALTGRKKQNVLVSAKRASAAVIKKAAQATTEFTDRTGALRRSIKTKKMKRFPNVYVSAGNQVGDDDAYYARWVEFGHGEKKRNIGRRGGARFTLPKMFMEKAAMSVEDKAFDAFKKKFVDAMFRQLKKK